VNVNGPAFAQMNPPSAWLGVVHASVPGGQFVLNSVSRHRPDKRA